MTIAEKYNQHIKFYNANQICADKIQLINKKLSRYIKTRFSIGAFYRLLIKDIGLEDVSKIIYLDADTIINLDMAELWNIDLENYSIAAVPEIQATRDHMITDKFLINSGIVEIENYFCSGVLVMNLDKISADFFNEGVDWLADNPKCECPDQDILNNFYSTNYLKLPEKFNAFVSVAKALDRNVIYPKIYHYAGIGNLGLDTENLFDRLFWVNFSKTPWFGINIFANFHKVISQFATKGMRSLAVKITAIMSGKQRAFFVHPATADLMKQFFTVTKAEEFILENSPESIKILIKSMKKNRGKKIYFIIVNNYENLAQQLKEAGFVENRDFLDSMIFMKNDQNEINYIATLIESM